VVLHVLFFILGIIQTAWIVWVDNLLHVSVNTAARCGAVGSMTPPCAGSNMVTTANTVFLPLSDANFILNTVSCSSGAGLVGTYDVTFLFVIDLTLTARSCYPTVSPS
jgi:hypothetical protein